MKLDMTPDCVSRQEVVAKKNLQYRLLGSVRRIAGLKLYEYDLTTGFLTMVDVKRTVEIGLDRKPVYKTQAFHRELCLYVQAINEQNAMKKVRKALRESHYDIRNLINVKSNGK